MDHGHLQQAPGARSEPGHDSSMDSGKIHHGSKCSTKVQPMHRVQAEEGSGEIREKEVVREAGEVEVSEEALAENLLHYFRRMKEPEDSLASVKEGLNNRLGVNPPSGQKGSVQARLGYFNLITLGEVEREGPTSVLPGDGLIIPTPPVSLHPAQAHQKRWGMSPDEEDITNNSDKEDSAATSPPS